MTAAPLIFMDTETITLTTGPDVIWEWAMIRREPDGTETEAHMFIRHDTAKMDLPDSFREDYDARYNDARAWDLADAAKGIHTLTSDNGTTGRPHVVGAVPSFDTERLALLFAEYGLTPGWHYHIQDVESLAIGHLRGRLRWGAPAVDERGRLVEVTTPPYSSDALSEALGVIVPDIGRHTAMGDARWVRALWDAIHGTIR